jgi:xanthine dehydrogenase/oxidase
VSDSDKSATDLYERSATRSVQLYEQVPTGQLKVDAVGRPLPHLSAQKQASGESVYFDDMKPLQGMLIVVYWFCC